MSLVCVWFVCGLCVCFVGVVCLFVGGLVVWVGVGAFGGGGGPVVVLFGGWLRCRVVCGVCVHGVCAGEGGRARTR